MLKTLSGFFPENTLRARRNLRSDIERRSLGLNEDFLAAFHAVKEVLTHCQRSVITLTYVHMSLFLTLTFLFSDLCLV